MFLDVTTLSGFYRTALGLHCKAAISDRLPTLNTPFVLGVGYAAPYLADHDRAIVLAMGRMGCAPWPPEGNSRTGLAQEDQLPIDDGAIDQLVLVHALEHAQSPIAVLHEAWRVVAPEGRLIIIVPNRRSLWALSEKSPFGQGQPFSRSQLQKLLVESQFEDVSWKGALACPPGVSDAWVRVARALEPGRRFTAATGWVNPGVWIVEARKRLNAPVGKVERAKNTIPAMAQPVAGV